MDLIKVVCEEGRQKDRAIYKVSPITFGQKRHLLRLWPRPTAPDKEFDEFYPELARYVPKWDFIGANGETLPNPAEQPDVFDDITDEELSWLIVDGLFGTPKKS